MALVPDQKFSTFQNGGDLDVGDIIVGLRDGLNTKFIFTGELPPGVVVPISQGGTGATTASGARTNLGLGTMAVQNSNAVDITGGSADLATGSVIAAPVAGIDIANKTYVDSQIGGSVTSAQGTANQVLINGVTTVQTGALVFTLPQNIGTTSNVNFGTVTSADDIISTGGSLSAPVGIVVSGSSAGGIAGTFTGYSITPSRGSVTFTIADCVSNYSNVLTNASTTGVRTWTLPDASGTIALTSQIPTGAALTEVDDTNVTMTLGGTPATALLKSVSMTLGWTGLLAISRGGTGVGSVTTVPTATAFAGWDSNVNLSSNSFIPGFATVTTAGATTTLTVSSKQIQQFTGTLTQTVVMPVVTTLVAGQPYTIINNSSGTVTVNSSGANLIQTMAANTTLYLTCVLNTGTTASSWNSSYIFDNGAGVLSITGTANQVIASASTGAVVLSLPQSIATTSNVTFANITANGDFTANSGNAFIAASPTVGDGLIQLLSPDHAGNFGNVLSSVPTTATRTWLLPDESGTLAISGDIPSNNYVSSIITQDSPVSISSATPKSITSLTLAAGKWILGANASASATGFINAFVVGVSTILNGFNGELSGPDATYPAALVNGLYISGNGVITQLPTGQGSFVLTEETTFYLTVQYNTNGASGSAWGILYAYNY